MDEHSVRDAVTITFVLACLAGLVEALGAAGFGAWLVVGDLQSRTDELDGLGVAIGLFLLVPALVVLSALGGALVLLRRGSERMAGGLAAVAGLTVLLVLPATVGLGDTNPWFLVVVATGLALVVSGVAGLTRPPI